MCKLGACFFLVARSRYCNDDGHRSLTDEHREADNDAKAFAQATQKDDKLAASAWQCRQGDTVTFRAPALDLFLFFSAKD